MNAISLDIWLDLHSLILALLLQLFPTPECYAKQLSQLCFWLTKHFVVEVFNIHGSYFHVTSTEIDKAILH